MAKELQLLSQDLRLRRGDAGPVVIRVSAGDEQEPVSADDDAPRLIFRALFNKNELAKDWEARLRERLQETGVQVGNEFFFVNGSVLEGLCDAAAYADEHEWLVSPNDAAYMRLAMERGRAKRAVDEAFDAWCRCARVDSAEIKINSFKQYLARDQRRIRDLEARYVKPTLFNRGRAEQANAQIDYAISELRKQVRKWAGETRRLQEEVERSNATFTEWRRALKRVSDLEAELERLAPPENQD